MEVVFRLLPVQKALMNARKPIAGIYSGRGVGKTYILSIMITMAILKGEKSLCFSQNFKSLSTNLFEEVIQRFNELGIVPNYSKGSNGIFVTNGEASSTGSSLSKFSSVAISVVSTFSTDSVSFV